MIEITLSRKLGELRVTQAELSAKTGIRPNTINELYHNISERVSLEHLDMICEALDCELSDILKFSRNSNRTVDKCERRTVYKQQKA